MFYCGSWIALIPFILQLDLLSEGCVKMDTNYESLLKLVLSFGMLPLVHLREIDTERLLQLVEYLFPVLPDSSEVYKEWRRLVVAFGVSGVQVHDARLVASMKINGILHILTLNVEDFKRYISEGITAVAPGDVGGATT